MLSQSEGKRLLKTVVEESRSLDALYGPRLAAMRAMILSHLLEKRVTQSQAGWNAFREAVYDAYSVPSGIERDRSS